MFQPEDRLARVFEVGIILKGLNGVVELVGGVLLLVVSPTMIDHAVVVFTRAELSEDPHDFVATHLLRTAHGLTGHAIGFGAAYLLAHGLVKIVLVLAVLRDKGWAYPWMIAVLVVFVVYQAYRIALHASWWLVALTVFDLVIIALTWREWRHRRPAVTTTH
jgi:uncharacterized membrane protein